MANMIKNFISGLSDRERRLVLLMSGAFVLFVVFILVYLVGSSISALEKERSDGAEILKLLLEKGDDYREAKRIAGMDKNKPAPPPIRTLVDKIASSTEVNVPDVKELPELKHGAQWVEQGVELSLDQVGIGALVKFMVEVEMRKREFPIAITKLDIRKRRHAPDEYDVKMTISTYRKAEEEEGNASGRRKVGAGPANKGGS